MKERVTSEWPDRMSGFARARLGFGFRAACPPVELADASVNFDDAVRRAIAFKLGRTHRACTIA
jgi:hypothetical protein